MRVITGLARGRRLETPKGLTTRPTAEKVKEAIFSAIHFELDGKRVLDLFAGSGQMGIEALSRGASRAVFVDADREAVRIIQKNLNDLNFAAKGQVHCGDYTAKLRQFAGQKFDIFFLDPPYQKGMLQQALDLIAALQLAAPNAVLVCECDKPESLAPPQGFYLEKERQYGRIQIQYIREGVPVGENGDLSGQF